MDPPKRCDLIKKTERGPSEASLGSLPSSLNETGPTGVRASEEKGKSGLERWLWGRDVLVSVLHSGEGEFWDL